MKVRSLLFSFNNVFRLSPSVLVSTTALSLRYTGDWSPIWFGREIALSLILPVNIVWKVVRIDVFGVDISFTHLLSPSYPRLTFDDWEAEFSMGWKSWCLSDREGMSGTSLPLLVPSCLQRLTPVRIQSYWIADCANAVPILTRWRSSRNVRCLWIRRRRVPPVEELFELDWTSFDLCSSNRQLYDSRIWSYLVNLPAILPRGTSRPPTPILGSKGKRVVCACACFHSSSPLFRGSLTPEDKCIARCFLHQDYLNKQKSQTFASTIS